MRIVLYTHHDLFEPALSLAAALAETHEVHLLLAVPAGAKRAANFEAPADLESFGLLAADAVLAPHFPDETRRMWRKTASFHLVVTRPIVHTTRSRSG